MDMMSPSTSPIPPDHEVAAVTAQLSAVTLEEPAPPAPEPPQVRARA
jgi:hypothetical protein